MYCTVVVFFLFMKLKLTHEQIWAAVMCSSGNLFKLGEFIHTIIYNFNDFNPLIDIILTQKSHHAYAGCVNLQ